MTTAQNTAIMAQEMKDAGIQPVGYFESMPGVLAQALAYAQLFGYEEWLKTSTLGPKLRAIVLKHLG